MKSRFIDAIARTAAVVVLALVAWGMAIVADRIIAAIC